MKKRKIVALSLCIMMALGAAACSNEKDDPKIKMENIGNSETEQKESETVETVNTESNLPDNTEDNNTQNNTENLSTNNGESSKELFANAKLEGSVVEFSDTEISLSIATTTTDENGGEIMAEAAPGMENEEELVHVTYGENVSVKILTMDLSSKTQISLEDSDKSNIKKETSVLVFGSCQDTYHWTADEVVIVRWQ